MITFKLCLIFILQNHFDACISHARIHMNHRLCNLMGDYKPLWVYSHDTAKRQPVLPCIQGTDSIGELVGKHRNHTVCQINTGSTFPGLPVESAVLLDIVGHICNMNAQKVILPFSRKGNGIIQVFCILSVNRHHLPAS